MINDNIRRNSARQLSASKELIINSRFRSNLMINLFG